MDKISLGRLFGNSRSDFGTECRPRL